jgi:hypothetical protein
MRAKIGGAKPIIVVLQHTKRIIQMSLAGSPNLESRSVSRYKLLGENMKVEAIDSHEHQ